VRTVRLAALVVVAVLLLTGCGRTEADDTSTPSATSGAGTADTEKLIHAQKIRTQAIQLQIAESIPGHGEVRQSKNGALFACAGGGRQWVGGADVVMDGRTDIDSIVESLLERWDGHDGYIANRTSDSAGRPTAEIVGADGEGYLVAQGTTDNDVTLTSSSRCFAVPDGFSGAGSW